MEFCSTETTLLEDYVQAAAEYFAASDTLATLVGRPEFEEVRKDAVQAHQKCQMTYLALELHREQHHCRNGSSGLIQLLEVQGE